MELETFVKETIIQIVDGIIAAQKELKDEREVMVAPPIKASDGSTPILNTDESQCINRAWPIDFDVAVTVNEKEGESGGAAISVLGIGFFGAKKNQEDVHSTVSRIRFTVPVAWPHQRKFPLEPLPQNQTQP